MTTDTLKSLGFLKKSLKMNKTAVKKNQTADNISPSELDEYTTAIDEMIALVEKWEAKAKPNPANDPLTVTMPTPAIDPASVFVTP